MPTPAHLRCQRRPLVRRTALAVAAAAALSRFVVGSAAAQPGEIPEDSWVTNGAVGTGPGNDHVFAAQGDDVVLGQRGEDKLRGQAGRDFIQGNDGRDEIHGQRGLDRLVGGVPATGSSAGMAPTSSAVSRGRTGCSETT